MDTIFSPLTESTKTWPLIFTKLTLLVIDDLFWFVSHSHFWTTSNYVIGNKTTMLKFHDQFDQFNQFYSNFSC